MGFCFSFFRFLVDFFRGLSELLQLSLFAVRNFFVRHFRFDCSDWAPFDGLNRCYEMNNDNLKIEW